MRKRYLKNGMDVLDLKDTNKKIYVENHRGYFKFVGGILVKIVNDNEWDINPSISSNDRPYILEEEHTEEATTNDIGKLCWFYDEESLDGIFVAKLNKIEKQDDGFKDRPYIDNHGCSWMHCYRLTTQDVCDATGYMVVLGDSIITKRSPNETDNDL